jgi:hypothetical protein
LKASYFTHLGDIDILLGTITVIGILEAVSKNMISTAKVSL